MKEIILLMQQLRSYPSNFFVHPTIYEDFKHVPPMKTVYGLGICNMDGEPQGFIETGSDDGVVIT